MKVLIQNDLGVPSLAYGFAAMGHDVAVWSPDKMKAFEAFGRQNPDLYVGSYSTLSPAILRSRGKAIIALWNDVNDIDDVEAPTNAFVFSVAEEAEDGYPYHAPWPYASVEPVGNYFHPLSCDALLMGDEDRDYDAYLSPLFDQNYIVRAHGGTAWSTPFYAGSLDGDEELCAIASCKVLPLWGNMLRDARYILRAIHNNCLPVVAGHFPGPVPQSNNPDDFLDKVTRLVCDEKNRLRLLSELKDWADLRTPTKFAETLIKASLTC
jgi:hypothetical protein